MSQEMASGGFSPQWVWKASEDTCWCATASGSTVLPNWSPSHLLAKPSVMRNMISMQSRVNNAGLRSRRRPPRAAAPRDCLESSPAHHGGPPLWRRLHCSTPSCAFCAVPSQDPRSPHTQKRKVDSSLSRPDGIREGVCDSPWHEWAGEHCPPGWPFHSSLSCRCSLPVLPIKNKVASGCFGELDVTCTVRVPKNIGCICSD